MLAKIGITVFPGSNCDRDVHHVLKNILEVEAEYIWHKSSIGKFDGIIIPGGFTYGDRLRAGAIAAHSPIMSKIIEMSEKNVPILGICNGFQILVESGLLPGALILNDSLKFVCRWINTVIVNNRTPFTSLFEEKEILSIPIAHGEGKFVVDPGSVEKIYQNGQVVIQYVNGNPNGSMENIAAVCNTKGNVMGMMPHPERGSDNDLVPAGYTGNSIMVFKSLLHYLK